MAEVKQDVSEHTKRIEEAEGRVAAVEEELDNVQVELASTAKRLTYLETKTDD